MQLLLRTIVLAFCVLSALALPNLSNQLAYETNLESFQVQLLAANIDTRAMTTAEANCANTYNFRNQRTNDVMIAQINKCFEVALQTTINNNRTIDSAVTTIRRNTMSIKTSLDRCSQKQENTAYLTCITQSFDAILNLLDISNTQAFQVMAQPTANQIQVDRARESCTNTAILKSKAEMTVNANVYGTCLNAMRH